MIKKKKKSKDIKETVEIEEKVIVLKTDIGDVLDLTADEANPVSDGKEFSEVNKDE